MRLIMCRALYWLIFMADKGIDTSIRYSVGLQKFLNPNNSKRAVRKVMVEGSALLKRMATQKVPVDTGNLKRSIRAATNGQRIIFEARAEYAGHVEEGTSRMMARPYMMPAVASVVPVLMQKLSEEIAEPA